jgi:sulfopyruvate decarboxylase TPP-binding subunit
MSSNTKADAVAARIADAAADAGISLVASLPDGWITPLIGRFDTDPRFRHVAVNREESAIGLCSGAYLSGTGAFALMGASGFLTCIYAITKINFTYQIPLLIGITLRGDPGDSAKFHQSNGLYLRKVIDSLNLKLIEITRQSDIPHLALAQRHARLYARPVVVGFSRALLKGDDDAQ